MNFVMWVGWANGGHDLLAQKILIYNLFFLYAVGKGGGRGHGPQPHNIYIFCFYLTTHIFSNLSNIRDIRQINDPINFPAFRELGFMSQDRSNCKTLKPGPLPNFDQNFDWLVLPHTSLY